MKSITKTFQHVFSHQHRFMMALFVAIIVGLFAAQQWRCSAVVLLLICWNVLVWVYLALLWDLMLKTPQSNILTVAKQHEYSTGFLVLVFAVGAVVSIISIVLLGQPNQHHEMVFIEQAGLFMITLAGAWLLIPTLLTIHYAHLYYLNPTPQNPVLLFPEQSTTPSYLDMAYFSFTLSLACQTADISIGNTKLRMLVLFHCILAFFFNGAILGLSLNVLASFVH